MKLSEKSKGVLLKLARETLESLFNEGTQSVRKHFQTSSEFEDPEIKEKLPCFVTLMTKAGRLRGCIGCLESHDPLYENVMEFTQKAAFSDTRFRPLEKSEVANLQIGISVLGLPKPLPDISAIEIGRHGLVVSHGRRRGVLLAKVAEEYGWSPMQFALEVCQKAGLDPEQWQRYSYQFFEEVSFEEK